MSAHEARDGKPVCVRAVRPGDKALFETSFDRHSAETIYSRFFHFKRELSDCDYRRRHCAVVAFKWWQRKRFLKTLRMAMISVDELYRLMHAGADPLRPRYRRRRGPRS